MSQELRNNNPVRFRGAQGDFFYYKISIQRPNTNDKIKGKIQGTEP